MRAGGRKGFGLLCSTNAAGLRIPWHRRRRTDVCPVIQWRYQVENTSGLLRPLQAGYLPREVSAFFWVEVVLRLKTPLAHRRSDHRGRPDFLMLRRLIQPCLSLASRSIRLVRLLPMPSPQARTSYGGWQNARSSWAFCIDGGIQGLHTWLSASAIWH